MLRSRSHTTTNRSRSRRWRAGGAILLLGIGAAAVAQPKLAGLFREREVDAPPPSQTAVVTRGPLSLILSRKGTLECTRNTVLVSRVEWDTRLTYIAPEGTFVRQGEVVARLDVSNLKEEYGDEQADVMRAEAMLGAAQADLTVQEIENRNALALAITTRDVAALRLEAYDAAEYPAQVLLLEQQITQAEDTLNTAEQKVRFTERMHLKDFRSAAQLQADLLAQATARQKFKDLKDSLRVLREHTYLRTLAELKGAVEQSTLAVDRQRALAQTLMLSRRMQIDIQERRLLRQRQQFAWATTMLTHCDVLAPHDGQVVYPEPDDWEDMISEGLTVRFQQPLAIIPDRTRMQVPVRIHESLRRHLQVGMPATLRMSSDPRRPIAGRVIEISAFPVSGRRQNRDLREYIVKVQIDEPSHELIPGLTADVDLVAASRESALQTPIEAVIEIDDDFVAFVRSGNRIEPRVLTIGESTSDKVEILAGLEEGERVMLLPREACPAAVADYERERAGSSAADNTLVAD